MVKTLSRPVPRSLLIKSHLEAERLAATESKQETPSAELTAVNQHGHDSVCLAIEYTVKQKADPLTVR